MYAAVPRIIPSRVSAGLVIVGDWADLTTVSSVRRLQRLREAEVQHLHRAIGAQLDVRGLQIAMDDALLVRGFERLRNLPGYRQGLVERNRALRPSDRRASVPRPARARARCTPSDSSKP